MRASLGFTGGQHLERDRAGSGALGPEPMTCRFSRVLRHQLPQLRSCSLVLPMSGQGGEEHASLLGPGIGRAHVHYSDPLQLGLGWLDTKGPWLLALAHAAPED